MECAATPVGTLPVITSRPEPPNRRQPRVGGELPRLDGLSDRPADLHRQQCASSHDRALERGEPSLNGTFRIANPGPVLWTRRTHLFAKAEGATGSLDACQEKIRWPNAWITILQRRPVWKHSTAFTTTSCTAAYPKALSVAGLDPPPPTSSVSS